MSEKVNVDNFIRAETARMFDGAVALAGGTNTWKHNRVPTPLDSQVVIRMNRDTLYSSAIVDISEGATLTIPETDGRYLSIMVINEDHYINAVLRDPGQHELTIERFGTPFVAVVLRVFMDPANPEDVATVHSIQDGLNLTSKGSKQYSHVAYDEETRSQTAKSLLELYEGVPDTKLTFGTKAEVDPVRHLLGTAAGWGGLPEAEAFYLIESEPRSEGHYTLTLGEVPVDGFWSMSIYNRDGFFEENPYDSYSINGVTAVADEDGSITLNLSPEPSGSNHLYVMDGWNYAFRLYRPRPEVLDGSWQLPEIRSRG